jgi:DNA-binding CsgD family transcriptional regulator
MTKPTDRENEIIRLRDDEKLSWREIAERLGTSKGSVNSSYRNAKAKADRPTQTHATAIEVSKPKETAKALDAATDPFATVREAARKCGFPQSTLNQFMKRLESRYAPFSDAIRKVKNDEMVTLLEDRAWRAVEYIDDYAMAGASVKDLAITAGVMIDKARLLKDQPTQILSMEQRKNINELMPALLAEVERRGMVIDVDPVTGETKLEKS